MRNSVVVTFLLLLISGCTELEGRVCSSDFDCINGYFCSAENICVTEGSVVRDAGVDDAGVDDAGVLDGGVEDAGVPPDGGVHDAGLPDGGVHDAGILICPAGEWDDDNNPDTPCVLHTTCAVGSFVSTTGTPTSDQTCVECSSGSFSDVENAVTCTPWVQCAAGTIQIAAGSVVSSPTCSDCAPGGHCPGGVLPREACAAGQWDDDSSAATPCIPHTAACAPGTFFTGVLGTALTDRECPACVDGFTNTQNAPSCTSFSDCIPGEIVDAEPTAQSDRTCAACVDAFSIVSNTSACQPWTACVSPKSGLGGSPTQDQLCKETLLFGTGEDDRLAAVTVDDNDDTYVAGTTEGGFNGVTNFGENDWFARRYRANKSLDWEYFRGDPTNNLVKGIVVAGERVVIVGSDRSNAAPLDEIAFRVVDRLGDFGSLDEGTVDGTPSDDGLTVVAADPAGNIYLVGESHGDYVGGPNPAERSRGFVAKYNPSMTTEIWRQGIVGTDSVLLRGAVVVADGIIVTGQSNLSVLAVKLDFDGGEIWRRTHGPSTGSASGQRLGIDEDGTVLILANTSGAFPPFTHAGLSDLLLMRLAAANGNLIDVFQIGSSDNDLAAGLAIATGGRFFVSAFARGALPGQVHLGGDDIAFLIFDSVGAPTATYQYGTAANDAPADIAITSSELVIVGRSSGDLDGAGGQGSFDAFIQWITIPD